MSLGDIDDSGVEEVAIPFVMCKNQYLSLYFDKQLEGNCQKCSFDESNKDCKNYVPQEIYDFGRQEFLSESQWRL